MTNEEAIQELKDASDSEVRYGDTEHHYDEVMKRVEALDMAIKALEQTRWIPVSERLPEVGQRVLATDKFEAVTTAIYFKKSPFWREMIVAWMPLPQPYKGESEDEE